MECSDVLIILKDYNPSRVYLFMLDRSIILSIFFLLLQPLAAEDTLFLPKNFSSKNLGSSNLSYFLDTDRNKEIENITSEPWNSLFQNEKNDISQFGYTHSNVWLRFSLQRDPLDIGKVLLEVGTPGLDTVEIYTNRNGIWEKRIFGDILPFSQREIKFKNFVFYLDIEGSDPNTFYLKVNSRGSIILPLTLHQQETFFESKVLNEAWHYSFYGILAVMIFYNGFIFFAFRSISYLLYSSSTLFLLAFNVGINGHGFQYFYPNSILIQNYLVPVSISCSWVLVLEFTIRFLMVNQFSKKLLSVIRISQIITFLFIPMMFFSLLLVNKYQTMFGIYNAVIILCSGVISIRKGYKAARYFVLGWSIFLFGILLLLMRSLGFLPSNFLTTYTMQIGSMFELVFLSLALADKYKYILEENNRVQGELLKTQIEQNENLEAKVLERTIQLNQSLSLIKQDLQVAKKIQQNTLMVNFHLIEKLEIIPFYLSMSEVGGDFYGINKVTDSKYRLFLADATGHGIQAALITIAIKGIYDNIKNYDLNIQQLMEIFNDEYVQKYESLNTYLTCIIVDIDIDKQMLEITSAGHPSCLLLHEHEAIKFPKTGPMIGIRKGNNYDSFQYDFSPGNRLFLYTDGIFEEFNSLNEEFGEDRVYSILKENKNLSIEKSIHELLHQLDSFLGETEKQDDITILGVGYLT